MTEGEGKRRRRGFSWLVTKLVAERPASGRLTLAELLRRAGPRGPAFLMLLLSILSLIFSIIPGFSTLVSVPLLLVALQLLLGRRRLVLPHWVGRRELDYAVLAQGMHKRLELIHRIERFIRPRLRFFCTRPALRLVGLATLLCTFVLALPVPLMNAPPTVAILLMALGILGRDGLLILAGYLLTAAVVGVLVGLAIFVPQALHAVWEMLGLGG